MPKVIEHFYSIQGEGPYVGSPSYFIRFSGGCFLQCPFCDSKFSWDENKGEEFSEVVKNLKLPKKCKNIILTGGEPIAYYKHSDVLAFVEDSAPFMNVMFETTMILNYSSLLVDNVWTIINRINGWFSQHLKRDDLFTYMISPKLNEDCYKCKVYKSNIFSYYNIKNLAPAKWSREQVFFKLIYDKENKSRIESFLKECIPDWFRENIFMMPLTPIPFNKEQYIKSCQETVEFCKKEGLRYSPRIHIDIYGVRKGV